MNIPATDGPCGPYLTTVAQRLTAAGIPAEQDGQTLLRLTPHGPGAGSIALHWDEDTGWTAVDAGTETPLPIGIVPSPDTVVDAVRSLLGLHWPQSVRERLASYWPQHQLGRQVADVLDAAGVQHAPLFSVYDGFDVLTEVDQPQNHVFVVARYEGPMHAMGTPQVRHQDLARWAGVLKEAGLAVREYEYLGFTTRLLVGTDERAADQATAFLHPTAEVLPK